MGDVTHFRFVRLRDTAERGAVAERLREELPDVSVGLPADDSAQKWDLSLVLHAEDLAAVEARLAAIAPLLDWLAARAVVVKAWSFATTPRSTR
jgi:hypothetical protein